MKIRPTKGLTFDDVLLVPKYSRVTSRQEVDTATWLTPKIRLQIPVISANMDTVTEAKMAIAMARAGGIGIIHRFMAVETQARQVERVKRAEGFIVESPRAINQEAAVAEARQLMERHEVGGLVVSNRAGDFVGLITQRDILLVPDDGAPVDSVMTRLDEIISVPPETTPDEARALLHQHRLEKLPVLDERGKLVGLITAQDLVKHERFPQATKDSRGRLRVGAALGVQANDLERAEALLAAGADLLVVDIAHGHAENCLKMVRELRATFAARGRERSLDRGRARSR
jgi:IMP dehydrogenase